MQFTKQSGDDLAFTRVILCLGKTECTGGSGFTCASEVSLDSRTSAAATNN
jgi:hypothetical protein